MNGRVGGPIYTAAIIGLGRIGSLLDDPWADRHIRDESWRARPCTHAGQFAAHPRIRLVAGADLDSQRRGAFAARWGLKAYADHKEMLDREHPDIVSVCTRAADRYQPTLDAIASAPRALLLEKHLSASLAEADVIVAVADRGRVPLIVNLTFRFAAGVQALAERVRAGAIGALQTVVCYPGALLIHSGVHFFDLCRFFGTGDAKRVFGRLDGDVGAADPPGSGYIEFDTGVRAYVDARTRATHGYMEFHGTDGVARVGNDAECTVFLWRVPPPAGDVDRFYQPVLQPAAWTAPADEDGSIRRGRNINRRCIDEVVACLDHGRGPTASAQDCLLAQEMATGMYASHAAGGRLIDLPLADRGLRLNAV